MGLFSKKKKEAKVPRMEENLTLPTKDVLEIIQRRLLKKSTYFGIKTVKSPLDSWVYQEIIFDMKPDVIVEIGNFSGGSTLMFAHLLDNIGKGKIIGVDITHRDVPDIVYAHPRITMIEGDGCGMFDKVKALINDDERVLVIEDSSHTYENTLNVLRTYSPLTKLGDYFIVEDSICYHGVEDGYSPGPYEAIETFVSENKDFVIDRDKESFFITWNPKGYLKRVSQ